MNDTRGSAVPTTAEFGEVVTAMVTPFGADGELYLQGAQALAHWLTEEGRNDGLVLNGTTGESGATSDQEKSDLLRAVVEAVGDRARIIAGIGSPDTRHAIELAQAAEGAGANALLVLPPYYTRPTQQGVLNHFLAVAEHTSLPIMLYDIPRRTGVAVEPETMVRASDHPRIRGVKDAKADLEASSWVMARAPLAFYSGDDVLNLPFLSVGAVGFISVLGHVVSTQLRDLLDAYRRGDVGEALRIHRSLLPLCREMFRAPAATMVKASLAAMGFPAGPVRSPLLDASADERAAIVAELDALRLLPVPIGAST
jgi:4-hydroxy-tetrahydrodipicolinate synthase